MLNREDEVDIADQAMSARELARLVEDLGLWVFGVWIWDHLSLADFFKRDLFRIRILISMSVTHYHCFIV